MRKKANYKIDFTDHFLIIFEINEERAAEENRMANILKEISNTYTIKNLVVIFRDFKGEYTQILIDHKGNFVGYEIPCKEGLLAELAVDAMEVRFDEYKDEHQYKRAIKGYL